MTVTDEYIREAMAAVRAARLRLAGASHVPATRHLAFAAPMGALVAMPALPTMSRAIATAVLLCCVPLIIRWDRRRDGMFVNGYRAGATRPLTIALMLLMLAMFGMSAHAATAYGSAVVPLVLGAAAAVACYLCSVRWQRIYLDELSAQA